MFLIRKFMLYQFLAHLCLTHGSGFTEEQYVAKLRTNLERYDKQVKFYNLYVKTRESIIKNTEYFFMIWYHHMKFADIWERCNDAILNLEQGKTHVFFVQSTASERKKDNGLISEILCMIKTSLKEMENTDFVIELNKRGTGVNLKNWDFIIKDKQTVLIWKSIRKYLLSLTASKSKNEFKTPIDFSNLITKMRMPGFTDGLPNYMWSYRNIKKIRSVLYADILFMQYNFYGFLSNLVNGSYKKLCQQKKSNENLANPKLNVTLPDSYLLSDPGFFSMLKETHNMLFTVFYGAYMPTDGLHVQNTPDLVDKNQPKTVDEYKNFMKAKFEKILAYTPDQNVSIDQQEYINIVDRLHSTRIEFFPAYFSLLNMLTIQEIQKQQMITLLAKSKRLLNALRRR